MDVTVAQLSAADPQFDIFGGFLAALSTNRVGCFYEHSNIAEFLNVIGNKEFVVTTILLVPKVQTSRASKIV